MNVLVTGGSGFLGQAVVGLLLNAGHEVAILNRSGCPALERQGVECRRGDLADAKAVLAACNGRDAVVHIGARAGPGLHRREFERSNVDGTQNVIDACLACGVGILVHTSSPSVVHAGGDIEGGDESLPLAGQFPAPYPATKAEAERRVLRANGNQLKTVALRPHLIWGPGDNHLLPRLIARNRAGRLRLPAPEKMIDTVFIDNAAEAHLLALQNLAGSGSAAGKAYFISNGEPMPNGEIISQLLRAAGQVPRIGRAPLWLARSAGWLVDGLWRAMRLRSDPPLSRFMVEQLATAHWFDISAARRDLGYRPRISIGQGLALLESERADQRD
ncbi:MAG: NAD-dependent epimerase/dehydratase family protein [Wenzhouxiangellaceae bacterium]|nr:NAD-dependent epimerase/dehydratase family protein [Wenzhouxiangellaceae bacterium]